jgi:hypothetical protein
MRLNPAMDKIDLRKERPDLYAPTAKDFSIVDVPPFHFFLIDGKGDPNTSEDYAHAVEALHALSYATKFASKKQLERDYVVAPLEGLWHADDPSAFTDRQKGDWSWTMMIRQPDWITEDLVDVARDASAKKKLTALDQVRAEQYDEGRAVQILHVGSYDDEAPTIARLHGEFLPENDLVENGLHHEIYLGDPRKVEPAKLKTVLRQPVRAKK